MRYVVRERPREDGAGTTQLANKKSPLRILVLGMADGMSSSPLSSYNSDVLIIRRSRAVQYILLRFDKLRSREMRHIRG